MRPLRLPPRVLRRLSGCVVFAVAIGGSAWLLGMDSAHAIGVGCALLALTGCVSLLGEQAAMAWPVPPSLPRPGSRRDVDQLGWALRMRRGRASPEAVRRLRGIAVATLALHGLDLDDPADVDAVAEVLGAAALPVLRRGSAAAPHPAEFSRILGRLEALASDGPPPTPVTAQEPTHAR